MNNWASAHDVRFNRPLRSVRIERDVSSIRSRSFAGQLWSHERGTPVITTVGELFGGTVHGLAIHTRSEVRAVRVFPGDSPPTSHQSPDWIDVIEGAPVPMMLPASAPLVIESLDQHDGALELQAAMVPDAIASLCVDYAPHGEIVFGERSPGATGTGAHETFPGGGEMIGTLPNLSSGILSYDLAPPRCAVGLTRKIEAQFRVPAANNATGDVKLFALMRDRGGLVVHELEVGTAAIATGTVSIAAVNLGPGRKWGRVKVPAGLLATGRVAVL